MQHKYRNAGDGFQSGAPFGRSRNRGGFTRSYSNPKPYNPPQPPRKLDVLMEAGRLAAEYLVAKGVLPLSSLPGNLPNGGSIQEFGGTAQDSSGQLPFPEGGRTSVLARLRYSGSNAGYGRRRFNDDYDRLGSRKNGRGRRRMGYYSSRGYGSEWGGRERGRNGSWIERSRGYSDSMEDEDDFAPGYRRERRGGYDEVGSSVSRVAGDEQHSKSEVVGESGGSELDDTGSKASSNSTRKDTPAEGDAELSKEMDDVKVSNLDTGEVKSGESSELENKNKTAMEDDLDVKPGVVEDESVGNHGSQLLKYCTFAKVPKKPRSSLAHKCQPVDKAPGTEGSSKVELASGGESELVADELAANVLSKDSDAVHDDSTKCEVFANSGGFLNKSEEETGGIFTEPHQDLQSLESSMMAVDMPSDDKFVQHVDQKKEPEGEIILSPGRASQENELSQLGGARLTQSSQLVEMASQDEEMMDTDDQLKPAMLIAKVETDSFPTMADEKLNIPASFKICDLNLMEAPEITEIPDDPVLDSSHISSPPLQTGDDKVIPVINLDDDSPAELNTCEPSKPKNEMMYPGLETVLNQEAHTDDLPVMQDSYSLAISDYLGADISCSPSVQADLNNLQAGMGIPGAEGFAGVDDAIYGSLGDIGFMEVWDQPTHEYEKFF